MRSLVYALLVTSLACGGGGDSSTSPTSSSVAGVWVLQSVSGTPMPIPGSAYTGNDSVIVTLSATGSAVVKDYGNVRPGSTALQNLSVYSGVFTLSGNTVTFTWGTDYYPPSSTGTFSGNTLTVSTLVCCVKDGVWVLKKR